ncbi:MAG: PASTA domain-containing protein [Actinobacteria bacterium]|nr:PASTA domain-containing protein [Actinomycetota bacterium]
MSDGTGPPLKRVSNVLGLSQEAAKSKLQQKGFEVKVEQVEVAEEGLHGVVVDQAPPGGTKAEEGSTVVIYVGKYVEPEPPPTTEPPTDPPTEPPGGGGGGGGGGGLPAPMAASGVLLVLGTLGSLAGRVRSLRRGGRGRRPARPARRLGPGPAA